MHCGLYESRSLLTCSGYFACCTTGIPGSWGAVNAAQQKITILYMSTVTNNNDKHIELAHFDYDLTFRIYSTYIFKVIVDWRKTAVDSPQKFRSPDDSTQSTSKGCSNHCFPSSWENVSRMRISALNFQKSFLLPMCSMHRPFETVGLNFLHTLPFDWPRARHVTCK